MNTKQIIQYLRENMPNFSGNSVELQEKIAMYIYVELGKMKSFDEEYLFGDNQTREKIRKLNELHKYNINSISKNKKVVCITISRLYKKLLKEFGINSYIKKVSTDNKHEYVVIKLKDGEYIATDLQQDLHNIQTKSRTKHFGKNILCEGKILKSLSDDEIYKIQKEMGFVNDETEYMDEKIKKLGEELTHTEPQKILEKILKNEEIGEFNSRLEYSEFYKYYRMLIRELTPNINGLDINYFSCYKKVNNTNKKEYSMCAYSAYKDEVNVFLFSNKTNTFIPVDLETLSQLETQGLYLGTRKNDDRVKFLTKCMSEHKKQMLLSKLYNKEK